MTNPDSTVGTNAGYDGRTTPNAFNDVLGVFSRGIVSGWACSPKTGMTVQLGGDGSTRDVAIAEDNAGNRTTINNRLATPVEITLAGAPATGNRIDSIVAYVDSAQSGQGATDVDFPSITGIIAVSGTVASTPTTPSEAQIRTAITNDGADGASAFYVVLANITVGQGVTTIGSGVISAGTTAQMWGGHLLDQTVGSDKLTANAVWSNNINWSTLDGSELGWKYLGQTKLTSTGSSVVFNFPAQYSNYKFLFAGEFATGSNTWLDVRLLNGSTPLTGSHQTQDVYGTAWTGELHENTTFHLNAGGCNQYETVNIDFYSLKTAAAQWRKFQGHLYKIGSSYAARTSNGRLSSATEPTAVEILTGGTFSAGAVLKVWASNN